MQDDSDSKNERCWHLSHEQKVRVRQHGEGIDCLLQCPRLRNWCRRLVHLLHLCNALCLARSQPYDLLFHRRALHIHCHHACVRAHALVGRHRRLQLVHRPSGGWVPTVQYRTPTRPRCPARIFCGQCSIFTLVDGCLCNVRDHTHWTLDNEHESLRWWAKPHKYSSEVSRQPDIALSVPLSHPPTPKKRCPFPPFSRVACRQTFRNRRNHRFFAKKFGRRPKDERAQGPLFAQRRAAEANKEASLPATWCSHADGGYLRDEGRNQGRHADSADADAE